MKTASARRLGRAAVVLVMAMAARDLFGQPVAAHRNEQVAIRGTERQDKIREVLGDKAGYAAAIVARWEGAARQAEPRAEGPVPRSLGQNFQDLVYTPVTPCRIVDTRMAVAGALAAGVARTFDVDSSALGEQGRRATGCGIPLGWRRRSR